MNKIYTEKDRAEFLARCEATARAYIPEGMEADAAVERALDVLHFELSQADFLGMRDAIGGQKAIIRHLGRKIRGVLPLPERDEILYIFTGKDSRG